MISDEQNPKGQRALCIRPPNTCSTICHWLKPLGGRLDAFMQRTRPTIHPREQLPSQQSHKDIPKLRDPLSLPCFLLMSDRASNEFDRYAKCVWRLFPILSIEDAESNLQSFRDVKSGETAQDNDSDIPCSHTSCKCDGITIPADTVNACTLFILLLGEICSPDHITTPPISTDVRIQAAKYILELNDEEVSLSKATAYTLAAQLMDRCGQIFQRDKYVSSAICVLRHLPSSTSRPKDSASEVFHINCMIWTLVHMEMESTHMMLNWYNGAQLLGQIESNVRALDLFIAKTQLWQIMKDFQDFEAGHPQLQTNYRSKLEDWREHLGLLQWKDYDRTSSPAAAHVYSEYWWATIHGSLPINGSVDTGSVDTGSEEGLRAIYAILQYLIVYRRIGPSHVPNPATVLERYFPTSTPLETNGLLCTTGNFSVCIFSLACSNKDPSLEI